jgi:hypothetical protein
MYKELINAVSNIPLVRTGKADVAALFSFHADVAVFMKLKMACEMKPGRYKKYLKEWESFMRLRNAEDFIPHNESKNALFYKNIFDWRND